MPWIIALVVAIGIALGLRSRKRMTTMTTFDSPPRRESCVLAIDEAKDGSFSLRETPPLLCTSQKRKFKWFVVAECYNEPCKNTYSIKLGPFTKDSKEYELFDSRKLEDDVPSDGDAAELTAKLKKKDDLIEARFSYQITITSSGGQQLRGDSGDVQLCPVWPCGDE